MPVPRFSRPPRRLAVPLALLLAALLGALVLYPKSGVADLKDHERARQALLQGQVLPLRTVIDQVERDFQGQVIKVEFEEEKGRFIYEIRVLQAHGRVVKVEINARDGKVLKVKRKK